MDWQTIGRLAAEGVHFGSPSVTHANLTTLCLKALAAEIVGSKDALEERLGQLVDHFAVPYGASTPAIRCQIVMHDASAVGPRLP